MFNTALNSNVNNYLISDVQNSEVVKSFSTSPHLSPKQHNKGQQSVEGVLNNFSEAPVKRPFSTETQVTRTFTFGSSEAATLNSNTSNMQEKPSKIISSCNIKVLSESINK